MWIQIILQLILKLSTDRLWVMFFTLQMMTYLIIWESLVPANFLDFNQAMKSIFDFEYLKVQSLIKIWYPDFSFGKMINAGKEKIKGESLLDNLIVYISLFVGFMLFFILIMIAKTLVTKHKKAIDLYLRELKFKIFWNGIIKVLCVSLLPTLQTMSAKAVLLETMKEDTVETGVTVGIISYIQFLFVAFSILWLFLNKEFLFI